MQCGAGVTFHVGATRMATPYSCGRGPFGKMLYGISSCLKRQSDPVHSWAVVYKWLFNCIHKAASYGLRGCVSTD